MSPTRVMHYFLLLLAGAAGCTAAPRAHRPKAGYFRYLAMEYQGSYDRPFYPVLFSTFADHPSLWSTVDFWRTVNSYNGPNVPITRRQRGAN